MSWTRSSSAWTGRTTGESFSDPTTLSWPMLPRDNGHRGGSRQLQHPRAEKSGRVPRPSIGQMRKRVGIASKQAIGLTATRQACNAIDGDGEHSSLAQLSQNMLHLGRGSAVQEWGAMSNCHRYKALVRHGLTLRLSGDVRACCSCKLCHRITRANQRRRV